MAEYIIDMPDDYLTNEWGVYYPDERDDPMPIGEPIVRCRDCRYASAGEAVISGNWQHGNCHNPRFRMSLHAANVRADGFCAWPERR